MIEVERKFLLARAPELPWRSEEPLRQGYVALDGDVEVRVRLTPGGGRLTVKGGAGLERLEVELPVPGDEAEALWMLTAGRRIEKVRRTATVDGALIEVDTYAGDLAGLVVAEVEFADAAAAEAFAAPEWLGREVTGDPRYANRALAVDGLPA